MSELPVPVVSPPDPPPPQTLVCANCHADLGGEYCAACGQRNEPHIHTVAHFAGEAFESISHADSRLWRTLWYLLARPGFLTREFFAGRRVTYLPPFRLYLVLSVIFFLVTTLPDGGAGAEGAPGAVRGEWLTDKPAADAQQERARAAAERELNAALKSGDFARLEAAGRQLDALEDADGRTKNALIDVQGFDEFCDSFTDPETGGSGQAARANIRKFCQRARSDGATLGAALLHNIPRAMFLFLPLLAGIMKLMYWRPKRYYVEHLLFLVHNHAAVFLVFSLVAAFSFIPVLGDFAPWLFATALGYMAWYIYRAMRNVYGQHGAIRFLKWFFLGWMYLFTALFTLLLTLIFTAVAG